MTVRQARGKWDEHHWCRQRTRDHTREGRVWYVRFIEASYIGACSDHLLSGWCGVWHHERCYQLQHRAGHVWRSGKSPCPWMPWHFVFRHIWFALRLHPDDVLMTNCTRSYQRPCLRHPKHHMERDRTLGLRRRLTTSCLLNRLSLRRAATGLGQVSVSERPEDCLCDTQPLLCLVFGTPKDVAKLKRYNGHRLSTTKAARVLALWFPCTS